MRTERQHTTSCLANRAFRPIDDSLCTCGGGQTVTDPRSIAVSYQPVPERLPTIYRLIARLQSHIQSPHDSTVEEILQLMRDELASLRGEVGRMKQLTPKKYYSVDLDDFQL